MTPLPSITVALNDSLYELRAVQVAAYRFGDRCHVAIDKSGGHFSVTLSAKNRLLDLEAIRGDFCNEVLDQQLRQQIAEETTAVRNLIIAQAFSQTSLLDPTGEHAQFEEDPLNISTPTRMDVSNEQIT